jgi:hypothetical protein
MEERIAEEKADLGFRTSVLSPLLPPGGFV